jgi:rhamnulokinase
VLAGPVEATAAGNIGVQAMALGHLSSLEEGRALVRGSFEVTAGRGARPCAPTLAARQNRGERTGLV